MKTDYETPVKEYLESIGVSWKLEFKFSDIKPDWDNSFHDRYEFTLSRKDHKSVSFNFWDSSANTEARTNRRSQHKYRKLGCYDVLACLTKSEPYDFENFCGDYGYDTDSRKALDLYLQVQEEFKKVSSIFSQEELEHLSDIAS
jgi:hypothetical protein